MRAQQRNRLIFAIEQIQRLSDVGETQDKTLGSINGFANVALKIARNDEAKFAGRVPPIRPTRR